jgi:hypothetical protein
VLFSIDPTTGTESTFHIFATNSGGKTPYSNLIYHAGSFMGDTLIGGDKKNFIRGEGVSFLINATTGVETVLDRFVTRNPSYSGLTLVGDEVYETIPIGKSGDGELDRIDWKTGHKTVLYSFTGGADGSDPVTPLIYHDGAFYGTTWGGNSTIFKFVP